MMFAPGVARGVATGSAAPSRPQAYGRQEDVDEDDDVELGKAPATLGKAPTSDHIDIHEEQSMPEDILSGAMLIPPIRGLFVAMMSIPYFSLLIFVPAICVLCALQAKKDQHPTNYYLLWTFTGLMSVSIAGICAIYQQAGLGYLVLQAFAMTAACFLGLTAYAMKSGKDFQWMGGLLSMGLMGMLMFSFLGWIFGFHGGIVYSLFGVVLFCGYILYDTQRVMKIYGPDDAIMASIELYLDILNLFLYILELLSSMQGQNQ